MYEDEDECYAEDAREAVGVGEAPGDGGEEQEEGEEVGKGRVGSMPCILCFCRVTVLVFWRCVVLREA